MNGELVAEFAIERRRNEHGAPERDQGDIGRNQLTVALDPAKRAQGDHDPCGESHIEQGGEKTRFSELVVIRLGISVQDFKPRRFVGKVASRFGYNP